MPFFPIATRSPLAVVSVNSYITISNDVVAEFINAYVDVSPWVGRVTSVKYDPVVTVRLTPVVSMVLPLVPVTVMG